jgi:hypothetical protein
MRDADMAPEVHCPACGQRMVKEVGFRRLAGYRCMGGDCVGFHVSVEDLCNAENWEALVNDAINRRDAHETMRKRNGALEYSESDAAFEKFRADFLIVHHLSDAELTHKLIKNGDGKLAKAWRAGLMQSTPRFCSTCGRYHRPTSEHPYHELCGGLHAPMPADIYFDYRGWRFTPPFICMGCGVEVCFRQWAFSRCCGPCDISGSRTRRVLYGKCFAGPHYLLIGWSAQEHDIPEHHFIDPSERERYPVMNPARRMAL